MGLDHSTRRARLDVARQRDGGVQLVGVVDVGVDQVELGKVEQQLAPRLARGGSARANGLGREGPDTLDGKVAWARRDRPVDDVRS